MTMSTSKCHRIENMSPSDYFNAEGVSKSDLDLIARSPLHYLTEKQAPSVPTPSMVFGTALHCFVLSPDAFWQTYCLPPSVDKRTKDGKAQYEEWLAANSEKIVLTEEQVNTITQMSAAILAHPIAQKLAVGGHKEVSAFGHIVDDVLSKARFDIIKPDMGLIVDIKTTLDARPDAFSRACVSYRYHVQAAYYIDIARKLYERDFEFLFIAIEKMPPYELMVYHANGEMVEQGRREYMRNLQTYIECVKTNIWAGYPQEIMSITLPVWTKEEYYG